MRARPVLWFVVAAALASPAAIGLHGAQDPQQPTFRTEANYVRVDVYPSSNGAPVTDLQKDDFEILEDGAPQTLDAFEHVLVAGNVPQEDRREPASLRESRAMLENPRARVFVIFLDYYHVDVGGSHAMRDTLVNALDRLLGAEDLFAVMTPEMSARDLSFARKTTTTRGMLERYWTWGERDQLVSRDPEDDAVPRVLRVGTRDRRGDDRTATRETRSRRHSGRRPIASWRAGRAQGRPRDFQRLAAVSPRRSAPARGRRTASTSPGRYRSAHGPDHDRRQEPPSRIGQQRSLRPRSHGPRPDRQPSAAARHHRRSEPRQRDVLSARSARPHRLRRADHEARDERPSAATPAAERRPGASDRAPRVAAHAGRRHRWHGDRPDQRSRERLQAHPR